MKRTIHDIALRRLKHGESDSMEEAIEEARKQVEALQKLVDQSQKLEIGYGTRGNIED